MAELLTALVGGFLGSAHCVGMCGGFVALVGANPQPLRRAVMRQLTYALGRIFTYGFLGALGGFTGGYLTRFDGALVSSQQVFSIVAGVVMLLVGVATFGIVRLDWLFPGRITTRAASFFRTFLQLPGRMGVFTAGAANGFLPCGLVYAFLAMAVASGHSVRGTAIMLCFGLGTIPVLTLVGCGTTMITHRTRMHVLRIAACLVIVTGVISIKRGLTGHGSCCSEGVAQSARIRQQDESPAPLPVI